MPNTKTRHFRKIIKSLGWASLATMMLSGSAIIAQATQGAPNVSINENQIQISLTVYIISVVSSSGVAFTLGRMRAKDEAGLELLRVEIAMLKQEHVNKERWK